MFPEPSIISRRSLLKQSAVGFGFLALKGLFAAEAQTTETMPRVHFPARAKRVIFLFMKGGPSHVDTFDPKPRLTRDDGRPLPFPGPRVQFAQTGNLLKSPWKFRKYGESGIEVSELFPNVARCVDDMCFLHSVHGTNPAHGGAVLKLHTGSDTFVRPSMGSWVSYGLGTENQNLPAFITICPTLAHGGVNNWGSAFLPAQHQGLPIGNASIPVREARVRFLQNTRTSNQLQRLQLEAMQQLNQNHRQRTGSDAALDARIQSFELAFRMQNLIPEIENINSESRATKALYGLNDSVTEDFGRQCLLARRFSERGVRFVQVTHSDTNVQWDQHGNLKQGHEKNAKEVDQPIAALLTDLKSRGLLDDTLVVWGGEFGRTPTAQGRDGRDHNPEGFTMWFAGGGVKGGFRYGSTDEYGYFAAENKMHIHDVHATILHLLGIDHQRLTYRHAGRDFRLTDVHGEVHHAIMR